MKLKLVDKIQVFKYSASLFEYIWYFLVISAACWTAWVDDDRLAVPNAAPSLASYIFWSLLHI